MSPGEFLSSPFKSVSRLCFVFSHPLFWDGGNVPNKQGSKYILLYILPAYAIANILPHLMSADFFLKHECGGKLRLFSYGGGLP